LNEIKKGERERVTADLRTLKGINEFTRMKKYGREINKLYPEGYKQILKKKDKVILF